MLFGEKRWDRKIGLRVEAPLNIAFYIVTVQGSVWAVPVNTRISSSYGKVGWLDQDHTFLMGSERSLANHLNQRPCFPCTTAAMCPQGSLLSSRMRSMISQFSSIISTSVSSRNIWLESGVTKLGSLGFHVESTILAAGQCKSSWLPA